MNEQISTNYIEVELINKTCELDIKIVMTFE